MHRSSEYENWSAVGSVRLMHNAEGLAPSMSLCPARDAGMSSACLCLHA